MHLLSDTPLHCHCSAVLALVPTHRVHDGFEYRCPTHGSNTHRSLRHNSWFSGKPKSIGTYISVVRMLAHGLHQRSIADETGLDHHTLHSIYQTFVASMVDQLQQYIFTSDPFFPVTDIVEVDESKMQWRGDVRNGAWVEVTEHDEGEWVFGMITRRVVGPDQRLMLFCTEGRRREDLVEVIEEHVEDGSLVCSDALSTYSSLPPTYRHHVINKAQDGFSREGYDRVIGRFTVNVNTCEAMWSRLRKLGTERRLMRPSDVPLLCTEFVFKHYHLSWFALIRT
jgi:hypothetical protein